MKIILATDFSPPATVARRVATGLARQLGDSIVVAHVVQVPGFSPGMVAGDPGYLPAFERSAAEHTKVVGDAIRAEGIPAEERALGGVPHDAVAALADELDARLVVLGTRGHGALSRILLGSFAERLVRSCHRPVLLVPEQARGGLLEAQTGGRPLRLTVALDRGPGGVAARDLAGQLRASTPADVTFVHLYDSEHEHARLGLDYAPGEHGPDPDVIALLNRDLVPLTEGLPGTGEVALRTRAARRGAAAALIRAATAESADLLVVGAPTRRGGDRERSRAVDLVRASTLPVLVAPARARAAAAVPRPIRPVHSVLAATDLSDLGNAAVIEAYRLLRDSGGVVELCHVDARGSEPTTPERWTDAQKRLWALVPPEAEAHGIVTRVSVPKGESAADAILQASERLGTDVVVVGSHGRTGLARAVLGSVADAVVRRSTKPVMIVRLRPE